MLFLVCVCNMSLSLDSGSYTLLVRLSLVFFHSIRIILWVSYNGTLEHNAMCTKFDFLHAYVCTKESISISLLIIFAHLTHTWITHLLLFANPYTGSDSDLRTVAISAQVASQSWESSKILMKRFPFCTKKWRKAHNYRVFPLLPVSVHIMPFGSSERFQIYIIKIH